MGFDPRVGHVWRLRIMAQSAHASCCRVEMLVLPSEDTGVADAMSKARESHRKLCVEEIAMLRLGGVASRTYLVAFPAIKQHFQQQGLDLDWVLYSSWDALVEAFVRREVDNQWC